MVKPAAAWHGPALALAEHVERRFESAHREADLNEGIAVCEQAVGYWWMVL